ncbi:hypothetical protein [Streptomyces sp. SPB4]|uniref:hypothetical protein n=1 Tax=Streptomyces sp. SPB4 TaxID=2940553 RepID=UPI0024739FFD|nr:hypothetical protein [Streptomyces sp. SPB4]
MGERETWMTEEFGTSHEGAVEVLLADGTVPAPVHFDSGSGTAGHRVSQWSVYDGRPGTPRAAALRAVCSCGWKGPEQQLDWEVIGGRNLVEAGDGQADACERAWDAHTATVEASTIPLPDTITMLLEQLEEEIDKLAKTSPIAAVRAARRTAIAAERVGYWAARSTLHDHTPRQAAAALGLTESATRSELARLGRYNPYAD